MQFYLFNRPISTRSVLWKPCFSYENQLFRFRLQIFKKSTAKIISTMCCKILRQKLFLENAGITKNGWVGSLHLSIFVFTNKHKSLSFMIYSMQKYHYLITLIYLKRIKGNEKNLKWHQSTFQTLYKILCVQINYNERRSFYLLHEWQHILCWLIH